MNFTANLPSEFGNLRICLLDSRLSVLGRFLVEENQSHLEGSDASLDSEKGNPKIHVPQQVNNEDMSRRRNTMRK